MSTAATPSPFAPYRRLGDAVARAYAAVSYDERRFPEIAARALEDARLHDGFDPDALVRAFLLEDPGVAQGDGAFGEPPLVLHRGPGFRVEALYWLDGTTDIHRHAFSGAFQVLHGASLHTTYTFTPDARVRSTLCFGALAFRTVETLGAGDVRPIAAGERFIHALFHLARPSVSLVVRTTREDDHLPQLSYLPPGLAFDPHADDRLRDRRAQALTLLHHTSSSAGTPASGALVPALEALATRADLPALFAALHHMTRHFLAPELIDHLCTLARPRHGELAARLAPCLHDLLRQRHIIQRRGAVTDPHLRWLLALLLNVPARRDILRLVAAAGHADPAAALVAGLATLVKVRRADLTTLLDLEIEHAPDGSARVAAILVAILEGAVRGAFDGDDPDAPRAVAARAVGALSSDEAAGMAGLVADLRRPSSPFVHLFR